jgi:hypothetical protein
VRWNKPVSIGAAALAVAAVAPAAPAFARGDDWVKVNNRPYTAHSCHTDVVVTFPVDREYMRTTTDASGAKHVQVTGSLFVTYTANGKSLTYNVSGPSRTIVMYPNGDYRYSAVGRNTGTLTDAQAAALRVPATFVESGPIDILFHANGATPTVTRIGSHLIDVCAALGLSG